ncbi:transcription factor MafK-like [Oculina patagonica]
MEEDCSDMLDLYLASEVTNTAFYSPWPEESVLSEDNNKMADDKNDRDIQDLFNGETNLEVNQDDDNASSVSWGDESSPGDAKEITDEQIANLRVSELNKRLQNIPWDEAAKIRKRRRNLKNRGYALTCRLRKQREQEDLMNENTLLKKQVEDGKLKVLKIWKEKEAYKRKYLLLQQSIAVHKQGMEATESLSFR